MIYLVILVASADATLTSQTFFAYVSSLYRVFSNPVEEQNSSQLYVYLETLAAVAK